MPRFIVVSRASFYASRMIFSCEGTKILKLLVSHPLGIYRTGAYILVLDGRGVGLRLDRLTDQLMIH